MLREYLRRIGLLLGGLLVSAVGITLMLQANIGLEPWSDRHKKLTRKVVMPHGVWNFARQ